MVCPYEAEGLHRAAGNTSAKGHVPFVIFALLDVLRAFPGQVRRCWPLHDPYASWTCNLITWHIILRERPFA